MGKTYINIMTYQGNKWKQKRAKTGKKGFSNCDTLASAYDTFSVIYRVLFFFKYFFIVLWNSI
jgi:hypothetical protein